MKEQYEFILVFPRRDDFLMQNIEIDAHEHMHAYIHLNEDIHAYNTRMSTCKRLVQQILMLTKSKS